MGRITREIFYKELKERDLEVKDFLVSIENHFNTSLDYKDFLTDFERKGTLTKAREAVFKMYIQFYDERAKREKIKKSALSLIALA